MINTAAITSASVASNISTVTTTTAIVVVLLLVRSESTGVLLIAPESTGVFLITSEGMEGTTRATVVILLVA